LFFLWVLSSFYLPGKGFSALLLFGDKMEERALPEFLAVSPFTQSGSYGYDGQFYVQLAVKPDLRNPQLATAVDNLPYRARRILLPWTAWAIGGGNAAWVVQVFSLQNVLCWLILALLLLRWFPASSWENYFRWAGVMLCFGVCFSVRGSLLDGPSLLVIAVGVMFFEKGRPWVATAVLAVSGLIRETNVMAASLFAVPGRRAWKQWLAMLVRGMLVAAPCALWMLYLNHLFGPSDVGGTGNFSLPFAGYARKISATAAEIAESGWTEANFSNVTMLVALTVQGLFLALRLRWSEPWWRIGAPYVVLMIVLGDAMWAGYPGAAARALLPMVLAFNVLVPRGRRWWLVLLLGNATVFSAFGIFRAPAYRSYALIVPPALAAAEDSHTWKVSFDEHWYGPERLRDEYWCWSSGTAEVTLYNPNAFAVLATVSGGIGSVDERVVTINQGDRTLWSQAVGKKGARFLLESIRLEPGATIFRFETDGDARLAGAGDTRALAFNVRNLKFEVLRPADGTSAK
jgi:hypothetical protein